MAKDCIQWQFNFLDLLGDLEWGGGVQYRQEMVKSKKNLAILVSRNLLS